MSLFGADSRPGFTFLATTGIPSSGQNRGAVAYDTDVGMPFSIVQSRVVSLRAALLVFTCKRDILVRHGRLQSCCPVKTVSILLCAYRLALAIHPPPNNSMQRTFDLALRAGYASAQSSSKAADFKR